MIMRYLFFLSLTFVLTACGDPILQGVQGEKMTIDILGPTTDEQAEMNPFTDYRVNVTFEHNKQTMVVPAFYAADGNAAETSASGGNVWRVHFRPNWAGDWTYTVSFRQGDNIAVSTDPEAGTPVAERDGEDGIIAVAIDKNTERLIYTGERYLQTMHSRQSFVKGGAGSPENLLGYYEIDGTVRGEAPEKREGEATARAELHRFDKHVVDWQEGDPLWQTVKGKGIIGGLNYLASKGLNSVYFLSCNIGGDGKDVYPYTSYEERERFDCSKLDQWEIIFDHMDQLGILQHVVLQETENELMWDDGDTGPSRKLYLWEMIARFAHHPRLVWNVGEENGPVFWRPEGQNNEQRKAMITYLKATDPYQNLVVLHTHADRKTQDEIITPLLGFEHLDGLSLQVAEKDKIHETTQRWIEASAEAGKPWVVSIDEIGPYYRGVDPDDRVDNNQDTVRAEALWGNLMAGGAGTEWYFGSENHSNDLTCEDWRTRDRMWEYTAIAKRFFTGQPLTEMQSLDSLVSGAPAYCLAQPGKRYIVYTLYGGEVELDLSSESGTFKVWWYNPRKRGESQAGSRQRVEAGEVVRLGQPPTDTDKDWAVVVTR